MKTYLSDILPRLKKYSQSLDQTAMLVDKPWVVNAGDNEYQKLIFKRDGTLLLSRNGDLTDGKWEYLPGANSIIIDYGSSKVLYRHGYLDDAVLALRKDGPINGSDNSGVFLLANENAIPDADAMAYLKEKYYKEENVVNISLENGEQLLLKSHYPYDPDYLYLIGLKVFHDSDVKSDGQYLSKNQNYKIEIKDGLISDVYTKIYTSDGGIIWCSDGQKPTAGDVIIGYPNGVHKVSINGNTYKIDVQNKVIIKAKYVLW